MAKTNVRKHKRKVKKGKKVTVRKHSRKKKIRRAHIPSGRKPGKQTRQFSLLNSTELTNQALERLQSDRVERQLKRGRLLVKEAQKRMVEETKVKKDKFDASDDSQLSERQLARQQSKLQADFASRQQESQDFQDKQEKAKKDDMKYAKNKVRLLEGALNRIQTSDGSDQDLFADFAGRRGASKRSVASHLSDLEALGKQGVKMKDASGRLVDVSAVSNRLRNEFEDVITPIQKRATAAELDRINSITSVRQKEKEMRKFEEKLLDPDQPFLSSGKIESDTPFIRKRIGVNEARRKAIAGLDPFTTATFEEMLTGLTPKERRKVKEMDLVLTKNGAFTKEGRLITSKYTGLLTVLGRPFTPTQVRAREDFAQQMSGERERALTKRNIDLDKFTDFTSVSNKIEDLLISTTGSKITPEEGDRINFLTDKITDFKGKGRSEVSKLRSKLNKEQRKEINKVNPDYAKVAVLENTIKNL